MFNHKFLNLKKKCCSVKKAKYYSIKTGSAETKAPITVCNLWLHQTKRVTSLRYPSPRHSAKATQLPA